jgi:hypothetical protein
MIPLSFSFLKSQPTVGELRKVVMEAQSPKINLPLKFTNSLQKGDKFVARQGNNQYPQSGLLTSFKHHSLMPRTSDLLSKININNIKNTETLKGDVIRSMGIEVL